MIDIICLIPARGGSKRLPGKNLALLNGKPLIAYSIEQWNQSKYYSAPAFVSTEDDEISKIAFQYGAQVIKRPTSLAQDDTPTLPVIQHAVEFIEKYLFRRVHYILLLQPTSPLRSVEDIDNAIDIVAQNRGDSVSSVCWEIEKYDPLDNGAIYITHSNWVKAGRLFGPGLVYYSMPPERSIDIDTQEDLDKAEEILRGQNADSGMLHQLEKPRRSKTNDKKRKRKRGRPSKVPTV